MASAHPGALAISGQPPLDSLGHGLKDPNFSDSMMFDNQKILAEEEEDPLKKIQKAKRFKGLLEWVVDQEGHNYMCEVDRSFIKNKENLIGLKEKMKEELQSKDNTIDDKQFNLYIRHLYKASTPTTENLADEKYYLYLQDIIDVYGMIHARYIRTPEGK